MDKFEKLRQKFHHNQYTRKFDEEEYAFKLWGRKPFYCEIHGVRWLPGDPCSFCAGDPEIYSKKA